MLFTWEFHDLSATGICLEKNEKRSGLMTVNHCLPGVSGGADAPSDAQSLLRHDRHEPGVAKQCTCSTHDCYAWLMCSKTNVGPMPALTWTFSMEHEHAA